MAYNGLMFAGEDEALVLIAEPGIIDDIGKKLREEYLASDEELGKKKHIDGKVYCYIGNGTLTTRGVDSAKEIAEQFNVRIIPYDNSVETIPEDIKFWGAEVPAMIRALME